MKQCKKCGSTKHRDEVIERVKRWQRDNREKYAEKQRAWRQSHPGSHRPRHLEKHFGLTTEEFAQLSRLQGGVCAICGREPKAGKHLHVDHDHESGHVRGLLCFSCNVGVGNVSNDVERLHRAAEYLELRRADRIDLEEIARGRARALVAVG